MNLINQVKKAKEASIILASLKTETKNRALDNIAKAIKKRKNRFAKKSPNSRPQRGASREKFTPRNQRRAQAGDGG